VAATWDSPGFLATPKVRVVIGFSSMRIIYLHGFASSPASRKARFFGARFESIGAEFVAPALDEGDFRNLRISTQLRHVESLLAAPARSAQPGERIPPEQATVLMGSSLGGYLAALLAVRHPSQIDRLVLLAPAFNLFDRWTAESGPEKLAAWKKDGQIPVFHYGSQRKELIGHQFIEEASQFEPFPNFQQDALIFHGVADTVVPIAFSESFADSHPNARLIRLQSGHELTDVVDVVWIETECFLRNPVVSH
jgi:uncharacterized protein